MIGEWIHWSRTCDPKTLFKHLIQLRFTDGVLSAIQPASHFNWSDLSISAYRVISTGWDEWCGGDCPVPGKADVWVETRAGNRVVARADGLDWGWVNTITGRSNEIVRYKVLDRRSDDTPIERAMDAVRRSPKLRRFPEEFMPLYRRNEVFAADNGPPKPIEVSGYECLREVLDRAFAQAATGKGHERHANGEPFTEQVMQDMARRFGVGALLGQAFKKSEESQRLKRDAAVRELLGAINYLAGAVIAMEKKAVEV